MTEPAETPNASTASCSARCEGGTIGVPGLPRISSRVQPKIVVVMGEDALSVLNDIEVPLSRPLHPREGEIQAFNHLDKADTFPVDKLKIDRAFVDEGPTIKRFRPRALGRATPIHKRTSHMTIELTTDGNGR